MRCALHASPFLETNFPMNMYERAKIALMILSAPVRIVIFVVAFATAFAHFYAATAGADLNKPLATWRRKIVFGAAMWCRIVLVPLGFLYINTKGFENYTPDMRS